MGIFDKLFGGSKKPSSSVNTQQVGVTNKVEEVVAPVNLADAGDITGMIPINLEKEIPNTVAGINLKKSVINLDKSLIDLSKGSGINLNKHAAKVVVAMDYSGSMDNLYTNGDVQAVLNRLMPLALKFDDDGELDVWLFETRTRRFNSMNLKNFENYVKKVILKSDYRMGGTNYAPVLEDIVDKMCVKSKDNLPVFVIFVTDGANFDKAKTDRVIRESAKHNIFIQFVGIGSASFPYLEELDDLDGRVCDNTGFIKVRDFAKLNDAELYSKLLEQYPDWCKVKGIR